MGLSVLNTFFVKALEFELKVCLNVVVYSVQFKINTI